MIDPGRRRAVVGPARQLRDRLFFPFGEHLNAAIGPIFHPTGEAESPGFPLGRRAKEDPLDATADDEVDTLVRHDENFQ